MKRAELVGLALVACLAAQPVRAQVKVEMAAVTCKQFLAFKLADPRDIAIWISGYYHGKRGETVLQTQELKENYEKLKNACYSNYDVPVMQLVGKLFAAPKP